MPARIHMTAPRWVLPRNLLHPSARGPEPSQTGNLNENIIKAISGAIQASKQNAFANRVMNTLNPPRAGLVSPGFKPSSQPTTIGGTAGFAPSATPNVMPAGVPTAGTAPQTGGSEELEFRQYMAQQASAQQKQDLADQIQRAKLAGYLKNLQPKEQDAMTQQIKQAQLDLLKARTKKMGEPAKAKADKYEAGSSTPDQAGYYDFNHQRADFDAQYGKGSYDRLLASSGYITQDPNTGDWITNPDKPPPTDAKGNPLVSVDKNGNVTLAPQGGFSGASIPRDAIQSNMARHDATLNRRGQTPQFLGSGYMSTQNPQSGISAGDQANPYMPKSQVDLQAIPDGQWFVNPNDHQTYQKQGSQPQKTSQVDTGDQGAQLASTDTTGNAPNLADLSQPGAQPNAPRVAQSDQVPNPPSDTGGSPQLVAANTPPSFDLTAGQPTTGGLDQSTALADAIRRANVGNQLLGIA